MGRGRSGDREASGHGTPGRRRPNRAVSVGVPRLVAGSRQVQVAVPRTKVRFTAASARLATRALHVDGRGGRSTPVEKDGQSDRESLSGPGLATRTRRRAASTGGGRGFEVRKRLFAQVEAAARGRARSSRHRPGSRCPGTCHEPVPAHMMSSEWSRGMAGEMVVRRARRRGAECVQNLVQHPVVEVAGWRSRGGERVGVTRWRPRRSPVEVHRRNASRQCRWPGPAAAREVARAVVVDGVELLGRREACVAEQLFELVPDELSARRDLRVGPRQPDERDVERALEGVEPKVGPPVSVASQRWNEATELSIAPAVSSCRSPPSLGSA